MDNEQPTFGDPSQPFEAQRQALARRRKLAEQLIQRGMSNDIGSGYQGGKVYIVGNPLGNIASSVAGNIFANQNDQQQQQLEQAQQQLQRELSDRFNAATTPAEKQQALLAARDAGVRFDLEKSFYDIEARQNEAEAIRQAKAAELAAQKESERLWREQQAQAQRDFQAGQNALYRRTADQIGARGNGSGGSSPSGDGKPLTNAQEKAALELGSNRSTLQRLTNDFKDDYAGDLRSTIQRKAGEFLGGAAPQSTQDMTRWWSDQAMFDELPQRHELFGATLTAGEKSSWANAAINPSMSPAKIRERLATRAKIYDDAEARMRGSAVAGGKSGKQFDAAVGKKPAATSKDDPLGIRGGK